MWSSWGAGRTFIRATPFTGGGHAVGGAVHGGPEAVAVHAYLAQRM